MLRQEHLHSLGLWMLAAVTNLRPKALGEAAGLHRP
jgi:hypothetical protein